MLLKTSKQNDRKGIRPHTLPVFSDRPKIIKKKPSKLEEMSRQLETAYQFIDDLEQELANQREARFEEGFDAGKKIGYEEGLNEIKAQINRLAELVQSIKSGQNEIVQNSKEFVLGFALKIVEKLVGTGRLDQLKINESKLAEMIEEVSNQFSEAVKYKFYVHQETVPVLEANLDKIKSNLREDVKISISEGPDLKPGDCIIETDFGVLDGRLETHFRQINNIFSERAI